MYRISVNYGELCFFFANIKLLLLFSYYLMLFFYLCVLVWVHCQFSGYDTKIFAEKSKYISRLGLQNCKIYVSYNKCVLEP